MTNPNIEAICITIDPEISLSQTAPSKPISLKGSYVAFVEQGSHPRAYKLHQADSNWAAMGGAIASVFLAFDAVGHVKIS